MQQDDEVLNISSHKKNKKHKKKQAQPPAEVKTEGSAPAKKRIKIDLSQN